MGDMPKELVLEVEDDVDMGSATGAPLTVTRLLLLRSKAMASAELEVV
jgi:hypothetical protein